MKHHQFSEGDALDHAEPPAMLFPLLGFSAAERNDQKTILYRYALYVKRNKSPQSPLPLPPRQRSQLMPS